MTLHIALVVVMMVIVAAGFWPFYAALPGGPPPAHWVVYVHAGIFTGWMGLLLAQAVLVSRRRVGAHQRLGRLGMYFGALVLLTGLAVTIAAPVDHVAAGRWTLDEAAGFLILPLGDMVLFGGFFIAAMQYRRSKETHKRLMVLATTALLFAPAARFAGDAGRLAILLVWWLPLGLAIAHEVVTRRRVERVYLVGMAVMLVAFSRILLMESEAWLAIGRRILTPWLPAA